MILPNDATPDKKWFGTLLGELQDILEDVDLKEAERIFLSMRAINDDLGRRLTKRRQEELMDRCIICDGPLGLHGGFGHEKLISDVTGLLENRWACSPICLADLQEMSRNQGRNKPGNLF